MKVTLEAAKCEGGEAKTTAANDTAVAIAADLRSFARRQIAEAAMANKVADAIDSLSAQVETLRRERDEARRSCSMWHEDHQRAEANLAICIAALEARSTTP